jgi:hypothetical protein
MKNTYKKLIALIICALMIGGLFNWSCIKPDANATLVAGDKPTADLGNKQYISGNYIYQADLPTDVPQSVGIGLGSNYDRYLPSNRIVIIGYTGNATRLTIPSKIDGYTVGRIGPNAFKPSSTCHTENLTYVKIPSSVYMLAGKCFANCTNLSKVVLSEGLEYMIDSPFSGCTKLTEINLPSTIIGLFFAFNNTGITEVTVPAAKDAEHDCLELGEGNWAMFNNLVPILGVSPLKKLTINKNNVQYCPPVSTSQEIVFNGTVIPMDVYGFQSNSCSTPKVVFKKGIPNDLGISAAFSGYTRHIDPNGGIWFDHGEPDETTLSGDYEYILNSHSEAVIIAYTGTATSVNIPSALDGHSVVRIGDYSFINNTNIVSVHLPAGIKGIGTYAFYGCSQLSSINLPEGITKIGLDAFGYCAALSGIALPESLEYLGDYAFENTSLTGIVIPSKITSLGNSLFKNCTSLNDITVRGVITYIGAYCFSFCSSLADINFLSSVKAIGDGAFESSGIREANMCSLRRTGTNLFKKSSLERVSISGEGLELSNTFTGATRLKTAEIGRGVTAVYKETFMGCTMLETLTIGEDVAYISNDAFTGCNNLKILYYNAVDASTKFSLTVTDVKEEPDLNQTLYRDLSPFKVSLNNIVIGNKVRAIGEGLFANQKKITSIYLPMSVRTIRMLAFFNCSELETVIWNSPIKKVDVAAFWGCEKLTNFNFNNLSTTNLRAFAYTDIVTISLGSVSQSTDYSEPEENLEQSAPLKAKSAISESSIEEEYYEDEEEQIALTVIAEESFENNMSLETVGIGGTVETIETKAFANCENLERAVISDSVIEIANDAFINCPKLTIYCTENSPAHLYAQANGIRVTTLVIDPIPNYVYTGKAIKPEINVSCSGDRLEKSVDFSVSYSNNVNAGTANVYVNGKGDYEMLSSTAHFTIYTSDISSGTVSSIPTQNYTGKEVTPSVKVKVNGRTLVKGTDYEVTYYNNINSGTATVRIRGTGNYSGSITEQFEIKSLSSTEIIQIKIMEFMRNIFEVLLSLFSRAG